MATTKVTFTFDAATIHRLDDAAQRLLKPKSEVVREAIEEYHRRIGQLSETEKLRMIQIIGELSLRPPTRPQSDVDAELAELRRARRHGGRRHPS